MVRNEEKFQEAVKLRKRGFTLAEIAKYCGVSKSTVSNWLKDEFFSRNITKLNKNRAGQENAKRLRLVNKARTTERAKQLQTVSAEAELSYRHLKSNPLFIAGLMIYQESGDLNASNQIRLSTTNESSHRIFQRFSLEYLGVERSKIRFWLLLYPGMDTTKLERKWSRKIGLAVAQFGKTQTVKTATKKKTLHSGVGNTIIGSTVLKYKLNRWIELATKELSNT